MLSKCHFSMQVHIATALFRHILLYHVVTRQKWIEKEGLSCMSYCMSLFVVVVVVVVVVGGVGEVFQSQMVWLGLRWDTKVKLTA